MRLTRRRRGPAGEFAATCHGTGPSEKLAVPKTLFSYEETLIAVRVGAVTAEPLTAAVVTGFLGRVDVGGHGGRNASEELATRSWCRMSARFSFYVLLSSPSRCYMRCNKPHVAGVDGGDGEMRWPSSSPREFEATLIVGLLPTNARLRR